MKSLINLLKKVPIDLGQGSVAEHTEGKRIAKRLTPPGDGKTALDLGARFGAQTQWLRDIGYRVTSSTASSPATCPRPCLSDK